MNGILDCSHLRIARSYKRDISVERGEDPPRRTTAAFLKETAILFVAIAEYPSNAPDKQPFIVARISCTTCA
jgi:hypothetical protein